MQEFDNILTCLDEDEMYDYDFEIEKVRMMLKACKIAMTHPMDVHYMIYSANYDEYLTSCKCRYADVVVSEEEYKMIKETHRYVKKRV